MSSKPVIFLAFANSSTNPLQKLSEEDDILYKILHGRSVKSGHFHIHRESHLDLDNFRHYLREYKNQVHFFHYAGHAGSKELFLSDGKAEAGGLAEMLAEQQNLKMVFLNGCSSRGQVKYLLELGIPAVIATREPIGDTVARDFAKHFYESMEMGASIKEAFDQAASFARAKGKKASTFRSLIFESEEEIESSEEEIWSLYSHPDKEAVLQEKFPGAARVIVDEDFVPNEDLLSGIWAALLEEGLVMQTRRMKRSHQRIAILNNFPAPIAENLRKLLVPLGDEGEGFDQIGKARIKQLAKTYQVLLELLTFTLLAQLWEAKSQKSDLSLSAEVQTALSEFLKGKEILPFIPLLTKLRKILDQHAVAYFVEELSDFGDLIDEKSDFRKACTYFDLLRERIAADRVPDLEYAEICKRAEEALTDIFSELGYLANYTLATIKNIDVVKYRHSPGPSFKHKVIRLVDLLGGMDEQEEEMEKILDNRSVLLLKEDEEENILGFLNLSPFIIDENAFIEKSNKSKIFFLNHADSQGSSWSYEYVKNPEDPILTVPGQSFKVIMDQLKAFDQIFLGA